MRKPRIQFQGALYHVIVRGNQRQKVFLTPADHRKYLHLLGQRAIAHFIKIYAYCLMPNHAHLLLEQGAFSPLSKCMQGLQTAYTKYFNRKHRKVGHLFQGRYKAFLVEKESYLLELVRYIHLNPIRAKLEEKVGEYPWTSHQQYLGMEKKALAKVEKEEILKMFGSTSRVKAYSKFVLEAGGEGFREDFYETSGWQVLGDEGFEARMLAKVGERPAKPLRLRMGIQEIWTRIKGRERLKEEPYGHRRSRLMEEAIWLAVEFGGASQTESARYFGIGQSGANNALKRLRKRWENRGEERKMLLRWAKGLKKVISDD